MSDEEREAQNMSLISKIKYNKGLVHFNNIKKELLVNFFIFARNETVRGCTTMKITVR